MSDKSGLTMGLVPSCLNWNRSDFNEALPENTGFSDRMQYLEVNVNNPRIGRVASFFCTFTDVIDLKTWNFNKAAISTDLVVTRLVHRAIALEGAMESE
jgi:hypothetical protein